MASVIARARHERRRIASIGYGGAIAPPVAVGGAALLDAEANGFATDFLYATDAQRVALKTSGSTLAYAVDAFYQNAGTSPKMVYDVAGTLVWSPHNMFLNSAAPATQNVTTIAGATYTVTATGTGTMTGSAGAAGVATGGSPLTYVATGTTSTFTKAGTVTQIQMNRGTVATAYLATVASARYGLALDYDPVTHAARGLLCEPAATNLVLSSEEVNNWTPQGVTRTADTTAAPTGAVTADTLTFTSNATDLIYSPATATVATHTFSVFAKVASGTRLFRLRIQGGIDVTSTDFTATTAWQRFSYTATLTSGSATVIICNSSVGVAGNLIVWGAQFELGSTATSYIFTAPGATVTRAVDQYGVTPASIGNNATTGSWWAEVYPRAAPTAGNYSRIIGASLASAFPLGFSSVPQFTFYDGVAVLLDTVGVTGLIGNVHKVASAFQSGSEALSADGLTAITGAGTAQYALDLGSIIWIGSGLSGAFSLNGYLRRIRYLPRRPTNAELATMTA